tara:strand:+ start:2207 stop:2824 length:618 start_codon:yes stop_codon:yes gene_type:complete
LKKNKSTKNWLYKNNREFFFKKSKEYGYRSRSAFKLIEMNDKFGFLKRNSSLLDLGSSPGGWAQVVSKKIITGKILAVDIKNMEKIQGVDFISGDLNDKKIKNKIILYFTNKVDVVLSDMAVNTSGNKDLDSFRTGELCIEAMKLAKTILNKNGTFISKIFMGSIFKEIDEFAKKSFKNVIKFKPQSSKKISKEVYIVCKGNLNI